jgi:hypothetical protein
MLLREVNFTAQNYNLAGREKLIQVVIVHDKDHPERKKGFARHTGQIPAHGYL